MSVDFVTLAPGRQVKGRSVGRSLVWLLLGASLMGMGACAGIEPQRFAGGCSVIDASTVRLSGEIDDAMQTCAETTITPRVTRVVVDSPGGDTGAGREIGRLIGAVPRTLVIDGECSSSCGNYFVPAAARIQAMPGSYIAIHGTPDPALMERSRISLSEELAAQVLSGEIGETDRQAALSDFDLRLEAELAAEEVFSEDFGVPKGWRLYREAGTRPRGFAAFLTHFTGSLRQRQTPVEGRTYLIVEPAMLESCLPRVDPGNYRTNFEATVTGDPQRLAAIERRGGVFSGSLACRSEEGAPAS